MRTIKTKDLKQTVEFENVSPHDIYEALMDSKKHSQLTGDRASISRQMGGRSTAFGDWLEAINVELIPDKKIVQRWRGSDWPKGHYSLATFEIKEKTDNGSILIFTQIGIPEDKFDDISDGWYEHYWDKIKEKSNSA